MTSIDQVRPKGLDPGIERAVILLRSAGLNTHQSCEGGPGHSYPEPTVCYRGDKAEGWQGLAIMLSHHLPVSELRRVWNVNDHEPTGPEWQIVFAAKLVPIQDELEMCKECHQQFRMSGGETCWSCFRAWMRQGVGDEDK